MSEIEDELHEPKVCAVCHEDIREGAKKCAKCTSYQHRGLRTFMMMQPTLALLVALTTIVGFSLAQIDRWEKRLRPSRTSAQFLSADENGIEIRISNTGGKPSQIVDFTLSAGGGALYPQRLSPVGNEKLTVPPDDQLLIRLVTDQFRGVRDRDVKLSLSSGKAMLFVSVQESDSKPGEPALRTTGMANSDVRTWILRKLG
jgi:predicted nucleic acid-binding Zn ribbon protein